MTGRFAVIRCTVFKKRCASPGKGEACRDANTVTCRTGRSDKPLRHATKLEGWTERYWLCNAKYTVGEKYPSGKFLVQSLWTAERVFCF